MKEYYQKIAGELASGKQAVSKYTTDEEAQANSVMQKELGQAEEDVASKYTAAKAQVGMRALDQN